MEYKWAIASRDEAIVLRNSTLLAQHYPSKPGVYDALYMPRATYFTEQLDIHDLEWGKDGLYTSTPVFRIFAKLISIRVLALFGNLLSLAKSFRKIVVT